MDFYGIKVGSSSVTCAGRVNKAFLASVCRQTAEFIRNGDYSFTVSSGAVASEPGQSRSKSHRSMIGQAELIGEYKREFKPYGIKVAQLLVTEYDLAHPEVMTRNILDCAIHGDGLIINQNDGTSDQEIKHLKNGIGLSEPQQATISPGRDIRQLETVRKRLIEKIFRMKTPVQRDKDPLLAGYEIEDNDVLIKSICLLSEIRELTKGVIIAMDKEGALDPAGKKINTVSCDQHAQVCSYAKGGNPLGRGESGALNKFSVCCDLAKNRIPVILAPGYEPDFILRSIKRLRNSGEQEFGTMFTVA